MSLKTHAVNLFIPHKRNGYKPHAIRHTGLIVVFLVLLLSQGIFNYQATGTFRVLGYATNVSVSDLLSLTNQNRLNNGISGLSLDSILNTAAQAKAQHMIENDYWAHIAPDGTTPWVFINNTGYSYEKAGENLAYGFSTSSGTIRGWMDSPSHKANILDPAFKAVGFGIANGSNYQGSENTVVVAMYAQPTSSPASSPPPQTTAPQPSEPTTPSPSESTPVEEEVVEAESAEVTESTEPSSNQPMSLRTVLRENAGQPIAVNTSGDSDLNNYETKPISNFAALVSGQAHWTMYVSFGAVIALAIIYIMRHIAAMYQVVIYGEHYVLGHPLLEASLIYAAVWILLAGTFGVIL